MGTPLHFDRHRDAPAPGVHTDLEQDFSDAHGIIRSFFELLAAIDQNAKIDVGRVGHGGILAAEAAERAFYNLLDAYLSEGPGKPR
jgi:hypothetical protein